MSDTQEEYKALCYSVQQHLFFSNNVLDPAISSFDSYDVPPAIDENFAPVIKKQLQRHQTQRLLNLAKQVVLSVSDLRR